MNTTTEKDREELLRIAKEKYPIGCTIRSVYNSLCVVKKITWYFDGDTYSLLHEVMGNFIYHYGKWAEIIKYPENYKKQIMYAYYY